MYRTCRWIKKEDSVKLNLQAYENNFRNASFKKNIWSILWSETTLYTFNLLIRIHSWCKILFLKLLIPSICVCVILDLKFNFHFKCTMCIYTLSVLSLQMKYKKTEKCTPAIISKVLNELLEI